MIMESAHVNGAPHFSDATGRSANSLINRNLTHSPSVTRVAAIAASRLLDLAGRRGQRCRGRGEGSLCK